MKSVFVHSVKLTLQRTIFIKESKNLKEKNTIKAFFSKFKLKALSSEMLSLILKMRIVTENVEMPYLYIIYPIV